MGSSKIKEKKNKDRKLPYITSYSNIIRTSISTVRSELRRKIYGTNDVTNEVNNHMKIKNHRKFRNLLKK